MDSNSFRNLITGQRGLSRQISIEPSPHKNDPCHDDDVPTQRLPDDTIHYLSPTSLSQISPRTVNEGDFDFEYKFQRIPSVIENHGAASSYSSTSTIPCLEPTQQKTIAIVHPDAIKYKDVILRAVQENGFTIIRTRYVHLTPEQVSEIYAKHYGNLNFPHMVVQASSGTSMVLVLSALEAVEKWKRLVGPNGAIRAEWFFPMSMRVQFGVCDQIDEAIHASDSYPEAVKENRYFNPESVLEPILSEEDRVTDYLTQYVNPTLLNGLAEIAKVKPVDPILYLADWLLKNNPYQPQLPEEIAILFT